MWEVLNSTTSLYHELWIANQVLYVGPGQAFPTQPSRNAVNYSIGPIEEEGSFDFTVQGDDGNYVLLVSNRGITWQNTNLLSQDMARTTYRVRNDFRRGLFLQIWDLSQLGWRTLYITGLPGYEVLNLGPVDRAGLVKSWDRRCCWPETGKCLHPDAIARKIHFDPDGIATHREPLPPNDYPHQLLQAGIKANFYFQYRPVKFNIDEQQLRFIAGFGLDTIDEVVGLMIRYPYIFLEIDVGVGYESWHPCTDCNLQTVRDAYCFSYGQCVKPQLYSAFST